MLTYKNSEPTIPVMQGSPPSPEHRVTLKNWDSPPYNRWSFQHVREVLPTAPVARGDEPVRHFPRSEQNLGDLDIDLPDGRRVSLDGILDETYTDGFLIIHRGSIIFERYYNGMNDKTLHLSQSMAKSVCATVAGILIGRGVLELDAPVSTYVPEFAACGYGTATLRQIMDMRSGVKFSEVYTDPTSDVGRLDVGSGWKPKRDNLDPENVFDVILGLHQEREHGGNFEYRSIETDVMAHCMERATNSRLADLVSTELWSVMGAECDADFTLDPAGYAMASGGLSGSLRDYGRFGQLHMDNGAVDGRQIVPANWVGECSQGDNAVFHGHYREIYPNGAYRNQFWIADVNSRAYMARGVFGQLIHIDPDNEMVTVKLSTWPDFLNVELAMNTAAAVAAIARELTTNT